MTYLIELFPFYGPLRAIWPDWNLSHVSISTRLPNSPRFSSTFFRFSNVLAVCKSVSHELLFLACYFTSISCSCFLVSIHSLLKISIVLFLFTYHLFSTSFFSSLSLSLSLALSLSFWCFYLVFFSTLEFLPLSFLSIIYSLLFFFF